MKKKKAGINFRCMASKFKKELRDTGLFQKTELNTLTAAYITGIEQLLDEIEKITTIPKHPTGSGQKAEIDLLKMIRRQLGL